MLKGTIYITYDINLCLANLGTCKTIIIADEPDLYNIPGKIGGSLLLPPYEALVSIIDNDYVKFDQEYIAYLVSNPTVNSFINIILQALIAGTNIIFLIDKDGPKFDMVLRQFFTEAFGIVIGDESHQFKFIVNYFPMILNKLYTEDAINIDYYLSLFPQDIPFDSFILRKMAYESNMIFTNDYQVNTYFKNISNIIRNGGIIHTDIFTRIG